MDTLAIDFFSRVMDAKPRTDKSDRTVETDERIYDHFWGSDGQGAWGASLKFIGERPGPMVQLDYEHLPEMAFYVLIGYCAVNHIPCLIDLTGGLSDLDPRYPYTF